jgi:hypothetical protein
VKIDGSGFEWLAWVNETGHANGHLRKVGDPVTSQATGSTAENLESAIAGETSEYNAIYPSIFPGSGVGSIADPVRVLGDAPSGPPVCRSSEK